VLLAPCAPDLSRLSLIQWSRSLDTGSDARLRPRPHLLVAYALGARLNRSVRLCPELLTALACLSVLAHARVLARGSNLFRYSMIGWPRALDTLSLGNFVKNPLRFPRINPQSYFLAPRSLVSCRETPGVILITEIGLI
jgi:hypothetical protein